MSGLIGCMVFVLACLATKLSNANTTVISTDPSCKFPIEPNLLQKNNPYDGRPHYCAAFARYGLFLLTGKRYITFGSAHRWAKHALTAKATFTLSLARPGDLIFFKNSDNRINHVAIVLANTVRDPENYTITFQDERGTHFWVYPESQTYLGLSPVFGADPARLETYNS
jgi:hypothetical protein